MEALLFVVAVAVRMTPELLPMVITVNLAKGALAMADKHVIVRQLSSIQNFGAMDVLATDKTGTLTQNRVLLERARDTWGKKNGSPGAALFRAAGTGRGSQTPDLRFTKQYNPAPVP